MLSVEPATRSMNRPNWCWGFLTGLAVALTGCGLYPGEGVDPDPNCDSPKVGDRFRVVIGASTGGHEPCHPSLGFSEGSEFMLNVEKLIDGGACPAGNGPIDVEGAWNFSLIPGLGESGNPTQLIFSAGYELTNDSCTGVLELGIRGRATGAPEGSDAELGLSFQFNDAEACIPSCAIVANAHVTRIRPD